MVQKMEMKLPFAGYLLWVHISFLPERPWVIICSSTLQIEQSKNTFCVKKLWEMINVDIALTSNSKMGLRGRERRKDVWTEDEVLTSPLIARILILKLDYKINRNKAGDYCYSMQDRRSCLQLHVLRGTTNILERTSRGKGHCPFNPEREFKSSCFQGQQPSGCQLMFFPAFRKDTQFKNWKHRTLNLPHLRLRHLRWFWHESRVTAISPQMPG